MLTEKFSYVLADIIAGLGVAVFAAIVLGLLVLCIFIIIGKVKLFKKCGKAGWKAIVPFYSNYVFVKEICGLHTIWAIASVVMSFMTLEKTGFILLARFIDAMSHYNLAIKTKSDKVVTTVFGTLTPLITDMVLGLNSCVYDPTIETKPHGMF